MLWPHTPWHGPGLLAFPHSENGAQLVGQQHFLALEARAALDARSLCMNGASGRTSCSDLAVHLGPGEGRGCGEAMEMLTPQVYTPERASLELERQACSPYTLGPQGTDKNGVGCPVTGSDPGGGWLLSVFFKRE